MRAVISGGGGFIGSRVVRRFVSAGWDVIAVLRPGSSRWRIAGVVDQIEIVEVDLLEAGGVVESVSRGADVFVHAAWDTKPGRYLGASSNVDYAAAGVALLQGLGRCACRKFIGLGSCQEYAPSSEPLTEDGPLAPRVPYAKAKAGLGMIVETCSETKRLTAAWLRIFNVYGPGENEKRLVPYVIRRLLADEPADVTSGDQVRDYLHVDDVASAVFHLAVSDVSGAVNVGSGTPVRVRQVVEELVELLGGEHLVRFGERKSQPGELPFEVADNRKLLTTGWKQRFTLREGLSDTVGWWGKFLRTAECDG